MRFRLGLILFFSAVIGGSFLLANWAFEHDRKNAVEECLAMGTDPDDMIYIRNSHYLCIAPDGRIVGRT